MSIEFWGTVMAVSGIVFITVVILIEQKGHLGKE